MKKFLILFITISNITFAKPAIEPTKQNLDEIHSSISSLEENITSLTSKIEELSHTQKQIKNETVILIKNLTLEIEDIKQSIIKESTEKKSIGMEIENLSNITKMLSEDIKQIKQDITQLKEQKKQNIEEAKPQPKIPEISDEELAYNDAKKLFDDKDYEDASIKFASNIKQYTEGKLFHSNLLFLGLALSELKKNDGACTAFDKIIQSNEDIDTELIKKATSTYEILKCKKEDEPQPITPSTPSATDKKNIVTPTPEIKDDEK